MAHGKFVSYLRVSTERQGKSGLGLEAQRAAVTEYLNGGNWTVIQEVVEIESGAKDDRPKLAEAMASAGSMAPYWSSQSSIGSAVTLPSFSACRRRESALSLPTCPRQTRWSSASWPWSHRPNGR